MKNYLFIIIAALLVSISATAQTTDNEMQSLIEVVKLLRNSTEINYNKTLQFLSQDHKWTTMNETGTIREGLECKPSDGVHGFRLNRILSKVIGNRKYVSTHGDMVNGEDNRYDFSIYERILKANKTGAYQLKGRCGNQIFAIVPYNQNAILNAYINFNGKIVTGKRSSDGTIILHWDKNSLKQNQEFTLSIKNCTSEAQPFVIINHNTRKE